MSEADRDKWDRRYREGAYAERTHPSAFLEHWLPSVSVKADDGLAADLGCGAGRNALFMARNGWRVDAFDVSQAGLDRLAAAAADEKLSVDCIQADLEDPQSLPPLLCTNARYALVIIMRYTNLALVAAVQNCLRSGGYLIVEEHLRSDVAVSGPRNPQFRVAPGALRSASQGMEIIDYQEGFSTEPDGNTAALAQLVARRP